MIFRPFIACSLIAVAVVRLAGASTSAEKLSGLLNNSPFGASRANAVAGTGTGDPLEFRAVLEESGKRYYSIYDTASRRSTWVEVNEPVNGFSVKSYDAAHDSVAVEFHGKSLSLPIKRAAPAAQVAMAQPGAMPNQPAVGGPMATPMDQQRLQQVQEEIRRRRALRQLPQVPGNPPGYEAGPQMSPANVANPPAGPLPLPVNAPGPQSGGPQPMPVPAKP